jgi:MarR family transcriptional regulator, organic hydroperoxide resistance regulator
MAPTQTEARLSPAGEVWQLLHQLFMTQKPRFMAIASEFDLWPPQIMALQRLEPDRPLAMSELAGLLGCDNSNVTGIIDRLEDRGVVERRGAPHDRRLKLVHLTDAGVELRERLMARLYDEVPAPIAALPEEDQRTLRDLLRRALGD